jgi:hypothetical protein
MRVPRGAKIACLALGGVLLLAFAFGMGRAFPVRRVRTARHVTALGPKLFTDDYVRRGRWIGVYEDARMAVAIDSVSLVRPDSNVYEVWLLLLYKQPQRGRPGVTYNRAMYLTRVACRFQSTAILQMQFMTDTGGVLFSSNKPQLASRAPPGSSGEAVVAALCT